MFNLTVNGRDLLYSKHELCHVLVCRPMSTFNCCGEHDGMVVSLDCTTKQPRNWCEGRQLINFNSQPAGHMNERVVVVTTLSFVPSLTSNASSTYCSIM